MTELDSDFTEEFILAAISRQSFAFFDATLHQRIQLDEFFAHSGLLLKRFNYWSQRLIPQVIGNLLQALN